MKQSLEPEITTTKKVNSTRIDVNGSVIIDDTDEDTLSSSTIGTNVLEDSNNDNETSESENDEQAQTETKSDNKNVESTLVNNQNDIQMKNGSQNCKATNKNTNTATNTKTIHENIPNKTNKITTESGMNNNNGTMQNTNITNNNSNKEMNSQKDRTINEPNLDISLLETERKAIKISREEDCRITFTGDGLQEFFEKEDNDQVLNEILRCFKNRTGKNRLDKIKKCRIFFDEDINKYTLLIVACNKEDVKKLKGKWPTNAFRNGIVRIRNKDKWTICFDFKDDLNSDAIKKLESYGVFNPVRHVSYATNKATLLVKANVKCMENFLKIFRTGIWINGVHIDIFPWIYPPRLCNTCGKYGHNDYENHCKSSQESIRCLKCGANHSTGECTIKTATELLCYFCSEDGEDDNHAAFSGTECCRFKMEQVKHNRYVCELLQDAGLITHEFEALKQHVQSVSRNKKRITKPSKIANKNAGETKLDKDTMTIIEKFIVDRFNNGIMPKFREETELLKKNLNKQIEGLKNNINAVNNNIEQVASTVNVHADFLGSLMDEKVLENILEIRNDQRKQMYETKQTNELLKKLLSGVNDEQSAQRTQSNLTTYSTGQTRLPYGNIEQTKTSSNNHQNAERLDELAKQQNKRPNNGAGKESVF